MSDLISRQAVMEMLTSIELSDGNITDAKIRLRDVPTAYDVDKVVEQICGCEGCRGCFEENKMMECKKYARIYEIVKAGGLNE